MGHTLLVKVRLSQAQQISFSGEVRSYTELTLGLVRELRRSNHVHLTFINLQKITGFDKNFNIYIQKTRELVVVTC